MTETQWLACDDPQPMLDYLCGRATDRKLRLFAVACCRRIWHLLPDESSRAAVEAAERCATGGRDDGELRAAGTAAYRACQETPGPCNNAAFAAVSLTGPDAGRAAGLAAAYCGYAVKDRAIKGVSSQRVDEVAEVATAAERRAQAAVLREVAGNPFRPVPVDPAWLRWNDRTVARIAAAIDAGRRFAELPVLADALEEAGCADAALVGHGRGPGPHVRGCWLVDALLGKE